MKKIIAVIVLICLVLSLSACKGGKNPSRPTEYDGALTVDALYDYAKRLEENGDMDAASQLYDLISKAAVGAVEDPDDAAGVIREYMNAEDISAQLGH